MAGSVNFNPFIKNVQYVDLEEYQKLLEQEQGNDYVINGDSQDEENVDIRLMSGDTERNYNAARKNGMKEEIANNANTLKRELEKYIEVYAQNYERQNPNVSAQEVKSFLGSIDEEFIARYMNEMKGERSIVMSDVVQEFGMFAQQKVEQMERGRQASSNIIRNEKSGSEAKYADLYNTVQDSQSWLSRYGSGISSAEAKNIKDSAADYIVNQMLNDNIDLLNQINPYFESYPEYRNAARLLDAAEGGNNPAEVKRAVEEAKNQIERLLNHSNINKIVGTISSNPPGGRPSVSGAIINDAADRGDKYADLYNSARFANSVFSQSGSYINSREENQLKTKTADFIVSQMLNDETSIGMLKALVPDYQNRPQYRSAMKVLAGIEYETDPRKVQQRINQAKGEILGMLRYTDGQQIADVVRFSAGLGRPVGQPPFGHGNMLGAMGPHDFRWHESFANRFDVSRNQHRLFYAAGDVGLPQGMIHNTKNWTGRPNSSAVRNINREIKDYVRDLKRELRYTTGNRGDLNKIYSALDTAVQNFDVREYIKKHGDNIPVAQICADFLHSVQGTLANQGKIENLQEAGNNPFNRNLMDSKYLVMSSGHNISGREKALISKSYARYMTQALMADLDNARQLASVGGRSYFNPETFTNVSLNKCVQDVRNLQQNPPASQREFNEQLQKITQELEFLINKMDSNTLAHQVMKQGAGW